MEKGIEHKRDKAMNSSKTAASLMLELTRKLHVTAADLPGLLGVGKITADRYWHGARMAKRIRDKAEKLLVLTPGLKEVVGKTATAAPPQPAVPFAGKSFSFGGPLKQTRFANVAAGETFVRSDGSVWRRISALDLSLIRWTNGRQEPVNAILVHSGKDVSTEVWGLKFSRFNDGDFVLVSVRPGEVDGRE